MSAPSFEVLQASPGGARLGRLTTARGVVETPAFMPVATQGSVKGVTPAQLEDAGATIVLANAYHLAQRPGVDVIAALGSAIGRCCYEVGPDVAREFHAQFPEAQDWLEVPPNFFTAAEDPNWLPWLTMRPPGHPAPEPRARLDLSAANRGILIAAGIVPGHIVCTELCTSCRTDLFFSYRRERLTGRLMAAIAILR